LLLDTSPKIFLDDVEEVLLGLCRQISHSIETARVVEEKIQLEKELLDQEHLARLGKAAATIAHEVKNPLSSIKTLAQLMKEDPEVATLYARDLTYMIKEVDRLNGSVQQLLSFARPPREIKTDIDLADVLESTARVLGQQDNNGVRVEFVRGPAVRLAESNPDLLDQIVLNLVLNAMQASDPGGVVQVGCENHGDGKVSFFVDDNGPGVPAELRERIFEPFYTTKQKGTGLGLAIVKKNVTRLRGEIEMQSPVRNGRGTRLSVIFPAG
jgi:signal transduction histidine kinase